MHELDGVGDEYVAIREWEQREWEKGEELAARSGSLGEAFSSIQDTTTIEGIEQLSAIVDKSSPQEVQESRAVQELGDWGDDGGSLDRSNDVDRGNLIKYHRDYTCECVIQVTGERDWHY